MTTRYDDSDDGGRGLHPVGQAFAVIVGAVAGASAGILIGALVGVLMATNLAIIVNVAFPVAGGFGANRAMRWLGQHESGFGGIVAAIAIAVVFYGVALLIAALGHPGIETSQERSTLAFFLTIASAAAGGVLGLVAARWRSARTWEGEGRAVDPDVLKRRR